MRSGKVKSHIEFTTSCSSANPQQILSVASRSCSIACSISSRIIGAVMAHPTSSASGSSAQSSKIPSTKFSKSVENLRQDSDAGVPWVVQAWRDRGLISGASETMTPKELAAMNSSSWFVRRNKRAPKVHGSSAFDCECSGSSSWVERRNRHHGSTHAPPSAAPLKRTGSMLRMAIEARMPQGVRPVGAEPAKCKISPVPSCEGGVLSFLPGLPGEHLGEYLDSPHVYLTLYVYVFIPLRAVPRVLCAACKCSARQSHSAGTTSPRRATRSAHIGSASECTTRASLSR